MPEKRTELRPLALNCAKRKGKTVNHIVIFRAGLFAGRMSLTKEIAGSLTVPFLNQKPRVRSHQKRLRSHDGGGLGQGQSWSQPNPQTNAALTGQKKVATHPIIFFNGTKQWRP
jgi:hypothetical protein